MRLSSFACSILAAALLVAPLSAEKKPKPPSPLDIYIAEAEARALEGAPLASGSLFTGRSAYADLASDPRATRVDDIVTIVIADRASAVSRGSTKSARESEANSAISKLAGLPSPAGALPNLLGSKSSTKLDGSGATTRETVLSTTMTARVAHVLPNGNLVIEGSKAIAVNDENQIVTLRGVVRPIDLTRDNLVRSDRVAQMEVAINGRGVVNDAIRRPNILYRILTGWLPF
jgi:flagellar L-ring protein FlgH